MAEVYFDTEKLLKLLVSLEEKIIVCRHGFHLGKSLFDAQECPVDVQNGHPKNLLDE